MNRWHKDKIHTQHEWKKHYNRLVDANQWRSKIGETPYDGIGVRDMQIGRYRKRKVFDCGHSQCCGCHSDKFPKRTATSQEVLNNLNFKEQLKEQ